MQILCSYNNINANISLSSKVHISEATLDALGDAFCVEPANGKSRSDILESQKIETFFISSRNTVRAIAYSLS